MSEKFKFNFMLYLISILCFMGGTIYLAALPELSLLFHVSSTLIKFSLTIFFIGLVVGTLFFGLLAEMYGRFKILIFSFFLFSAASLLCCFSTSISWFLLGRFIQGLGLASGPIIAIALVADRYKGDEYNKYIAYVLMMIGLGGGIGPILGSFILHLFSWKVIFYFLTSMGVLAIGLIVNTRKSIHFKTQKIIMIGKEYGHFFKHPFFTYFCLLVGVLHGAFYTFMIISPYIFRLHYGWSIIDFAWVGFVLALSQSFGAYLERVLIDRIRNLKVFLFGLGVIAVSFLLFFLIGLPVHGILFLLTSALFALGISLSVTYLIATAEEINPHFSGIASSLINLTKITFISLALIFVLFLPETLNVINLFIFGALVICGLGYLKIRKFS